MSVSSFNNILSFAFSSDDGSVVLGDLQDDYSQEPKKKVK